MTSLRTFLPQADWQAERRARGRCSCVTCWAAYLRGESLGAPIWNYLMGSAS